MTPLEKTKTRIFVVEDDPATLELIVTRLSVAGYEITYARDGGEAVSGILSNRPAAVILDVNMPILDGFGVMRALRDNPSISARMPIMVLTARNSPEDVRRAIQLGARDFLSKPFKDAQLLDRVARLLRAPPAASKPAVYL
jgi:two-component system chemotaxis response regulator CheY